MVGALLQLHDDVQQHHLRAAVLDAERLEIPRQNVPVVASEKIIYCYFYQWAYIVGKYFPEPIKNLFSIEATSEDLWNINICSFCSRTDQQHHRPSILSLTKLILLYIYLFIHYPKRFVMFKLLKPI